MTDWQLMVRVRCGFCGRSAARIGQAHPRDVYLQLFFTMRLALPGRDYEEGAAWKFGYWNRDSPRTPAEQGPPPAGGGIHRTKGMFRIWDPRVYGPPPPWPPAWPENRDEMPFDEFKAALGRYEHVASVQNRLWNCPRCDAFLGLSETELREALRSFESQGRPQTVRAFAPRLHLPTT